MLNSLKKTSVFIPLILLGLVMSGSANETADLVITSNIKGASIYLDGDIQEIQTPAVLKNIPAKEYVVRLVNEFDKELIESFSISDSTQNKLHMEFPVGNLTITSNLDSTIVFINERQMGPAPLVLEKFVEGEYEIRLVELYGHSTRRTVFVFANRDNNVPLDFELADLIIESNLENARIILNDRNTGLIVPTTIRSLAEGAYTVILKKGINRMRKEVFIRTDSENVVSLNHISWLSSKKWYFVSAGVLAATTGTILLTGEDKTEDAAILGPPPFPGND